MLGLLPYQDTCRVSLREAPQRSLQAHCTLQRALHLEAARNQYCSMALRCSNLNDMKCHMICH